MLIVPGTCGTAVLYLPAYRRELDDHGDAGLHGLLDRLDHRGPVIGLNDDDVEALRHHGVLQLVDLSRALEIGIYERRGGVVGRCVLLGTRPTSPGEGVRLGEAEEADVQFLIAGRRGVEFGVDLNSSSRVCWSLPVSAPARRRRDAASRWLESQLLLRGGRGEQKGVDSSPGLTRTVRERQARPVWCPAVRRAPGNQPARIIDPPPVSAASSQSATIRCVTGLCRWPVAIRRLGTHRTSGRAPDPVPFVDASSAPLRPAAARRSADCGSLELPESSKRRVPEC